MNTYYITVASHAVALSIDPEAELRTVLPATQAYGMRCCGPQFVYKLPERYVYRVTVARRKDARRTGVIRCRAHERSVYPTTIHYRVC